VQADAAQCDDLLAYVATVSPTLAAAPVTRRQACYLPQHIRHGSERGPMLGPTGVPGLWVASGHTCWGIQNGPGTGCLMAEMLLDPAGPRSARVDKLDPRRFMKGKIVPVASGEKMKTRSTPAG
jgi:glycine/D-amino acid oxidase-like deaminating enzyme